MNDARLGALAAPHFTGYQPHAAGAAVAGATVIGQIDAIAQSRVQQQLAAARPKAIPIDSNLVTSCHCPRTPQPFSFGSRNAEFSFVRHFAASNLKGDAQYELLQNSQFNALIFLQQ
jgi:hypothetical protein